MDGLVVTSMRLHTVLTQPLSDRYGLVVVSGQVEVIDEVNAFPQRAGVRVAPMTSEGSDGQASKASSFLRAIDMFQRPSHVDSTHRGGITVGPEVSYVPVEDLVQPSESLLRALIL
jgi:hypothetical protein